MSKFQHSRIRTGSALEPMTSVDVVEVAPDMAQHAASERCPSAEPVEATGLQDRRAVERLVANPLAINESATWLDSFGRTIASPALNIRARCDVIGMVTLCGMNLAGVFVVGCCAVGADAPGSVSG